MTLEAIAAVMGMSPGLLSEHARSLPRQPARPWRIDDIARMFQVHPSWVREWAASGHLELHTIPWSWRRGATFLALKAFVRNPGRWMDWDPDQVTHESLRESARMARSVGLRWYSRDEAADYLGMDPSKVSRWVKLGDLDAVKHRGKLWFRETELHRFKTTYHTTKRRAGGKYAPTSADRPPPEDR